MILEERIHRCPALVFRYTNRIKELKQLKVSDPTNADKYEWGIKISKWMLNSMWGSTFR